MSLISNKVGYITPAIYLVKTDADLTAMGDPVLGANESIKVVTETQAFIAHGDGVTALSELNQIPLVAEVEEEEQ